ncbi:hypothetical protein LCGC14_0485460 [marine sediment metagenome]|uniref:Uncharacterized protein n=1 Tax=marine sediment metagenome TaxID=412755 RepID=A0A0F9SRB6_9ZZZZ|nr:MAG: hypothetical protein Lokiarch_06540 [Candidatus Lokiarchaeum sp. GC14_75]
MNTTTDKADFDFNLILDGTHNPTVNYTFSLPEGFSSPPPGTISQSLNENVEYHISANNQFEYVGIYYFEMNITMEDELIYTESIPFRIPVVEGLTITQLSIIFEEDEFNGNYTATFDFMDDNLGGNPTGWTTSEIGESSVQVISSLGEHEHVVSIYDAYESHTAWIKDTFSTQTEGTIELWFRTSDISQPISIELAGTGGGLKLYFKDSKLQYYDTAYHDIDISIASNTWYHIAFEFYVSSGGDGTDDWHLRINGKLTTLDGYEYYNNPTNIFQILVKSSSASADYYSYVDAVGYSWDSDYVIGDNMYKTETNTDTYGSSTQLEIGDTLFIEYKTNSKAEVVLNFLNNDVIQATYTVIPRGNVYQGIQSQTIIIDETFLFDEIGFSSHEYNWFEVNHISIIDATNIISQEFNPLNFTNNGNIPEFVSFDIFGVPFENIDQTLYPGEFFGETQVAVILPNSNRISEFNITLPEESISNLFLRGITYSRSGTNEIYNLYIDNLEIDGIHIVSPENMNI